MFSYIFSTELFINFKLDLIKFLYIVYCRKQKIHSIMYTIIITTAVFFIAAVLTAYFKCNHSLKGCYKNIAVATIIGIVFGILISINLPSEYEVIELGEYTVVESQDTVFDIKENNIHFYYYADDGEVGEMSVNAKEISIKYSCEKTPNIKLKKYVNTSHFSSKIDYYLTAEITIRPPED